MTPDEATTILDKHLSELAEHFDSIQVVATYIKDGGEGTLFIPRGVGNWYARLGSTREWVDNAQADNIGRAVAENNKNESS